ncbi:gamma-glutamyl-gamma-aminobutyrate hydrolase family protein [Porticoccaceae bacterium LTM1]|nr:gamma-glutamyl-gamma-aminobutyrate hydrolase family protein [Porticoccaceae bacterium LTM1]
MAKILVFQHVPYEPLGLLDPLLREHRHRIRYINFARTDAEIPPLKNYGGLIVLGGPMNIGEEHQYPHLELEKQALREALELELPILGICLGAQLLASALGARVYRIEKPEIGWHELHRTDRGSTDPVACHFEKTEQIFQWHGYTFELPKTAELLLQGQNCVNQAFRAGHNAYGFQFHLEACQQLIRRWVNLPAHKDELATLGGVTAQQIKEATTEHLPRSQQLANQVFGAFVNLLPAVRRQHQIGSR